MKKSLFPSSTIVDPSPRTGVYEGDLKYGRTSHGESVKRKDYTAERQNGVPSNPAAVVLPIVQPRDPQVWTKDNRVKEARKHVVNSQYDITKLLIAWRQNSFMRLRVGKQFV